MIAFCLIIGPLYSINTSPHKMLQQDKPEADVTCRCGAPGHSRYMRLGRHAYALQVVMVGDFTSSGCLTGFTGAGFPLGIHT